MSSPTKSLQEKKSVSRSKDQTAVSWKVSATTPSHAQTNVKSVSIDLSKGFAADEAGTLAPGPPAISNSLASAASAQLSKELQAHIARYFKEGWHRKEAFHAYEEFTKAPKVSIPSNLSNPLMHPLLSNAMLTFQGKRYRFCTACARALAQDEAPSVSICPQCKCVSICRKCRTAIWYMQLSLILCN